MLQSSATDLYNCTLNQSNNNNYNINNSNSNGLLAHTSETLAQLPVDGSINAHAHRRSFDISLHPIPFVDPMMLSPAMRRTFSMSGSALPPFNTANTSTNIATTTTNNTTNNASTGLLRTASKTNIIPINTNNSTSNNNTTINTTTNSNNNNISIE